MKDRRTVFENMGDVPGEEGIVPPPSKKKKLSLGRPRFENIQGLRPGEHGEEYSVGREGVSGLEERKEPECAGGAMSERPVRNSRSCSNKLLAVQVCGRKMFGDLTNVSIGSITINVNHNANSNI